MPLHLLPNTLGPVEDHTDFLPHSVDKIVPTLHGLFAESEKGAHSFLKYFKRHLPLQLLNEHTKSTDIDFLLEPVKKGESWGLISDAGLPCMADPGSKLVLRAHQLQIPVHAYSGPSSLTHALMLSGLPSQNFTFHGYITKSPQERPKILQQWEQTPTTHIFIEAPYRNQHTLASCLQALHPKTLLCVCWNLTLPSQGTFTAPISFWRKHPIPPLHKLPAIFLFYPN